MLIDRAALLDDRSLVPPATDRAIIDWRQKWEMPLVQC